MSRPDDAGPDTGDARAPDGADASPVGGGSAGEPASASTVEHRAEPQPGAAAAEPPQRPVDGDAAAAARTEPGTGSGPATGPSAATGADPAAPPGSTAEPAVQPDGPAARPAAPHGEPSSGSAAPQDSPTAAAPAAPPAGASTGASTGADVGPAAGGRPGDAAQTAAVPADQDAEPALEPALEHEAEQDAGPAGGHPSRHGRLVVALVAATAVLLVAAAGWLTWLLYGERQDEAARRDAITAARQLALNLTSIDNEDFSGDVARILDGSTGAFREDFTARTGELERLIGQNQVAAEGRVLQSSIVRSDRDSATALLVVDATVRNAASPEPQQRRYVMSLDVERVGNQWLVSGVEFI